MTTDRSTDKFNRPYARLSALKPGDIVQVDGDFDCIQPWSRVPVLRSSHGLYVPCDKGHHYLDGQADDGDSLIGVYHV